MVGILIFFHCESNPGFAAASHEITFYNMARRLVGDPANIHFAYRTTENGRSPTLPEDLVHVFEFDAASRSHEYLSQIEAYVRKHNIQIAFGFDQPVRRLSHKYLRRGGVKHIVSYWGAPMSSLNHGLKLALKKLYVSLCRHRPDHFIFQSEGMRLTATHGQGIPVEATSLVRSGINTERFCPPRGRDWYAHDIFNIDRKRKIVFFSGHMEERKGVDVIIRTAVHLCETLGRTDVHFLLLGNRDGQEKHFLPLYQGTAAEQHITFGGYRHDVPQLLKSCTLGMIASTEWDSFPMSSIEMAATGLPLVVSDLPGLREAVTPETGFLYPVGDHESAGAQLRTLLDDEVLRVRMGRAARHRAVTEFSVEQQMLGMEAVVRQVAGHLLPEDTPDNATFAVT
ncbi:glycosyltransferase family 4 protein [Gilvimarinus sp. F26214L]|uniref:glycosyltransferase family 4 protein n=1 Tax=Gilvimarinus sp. DZF01 TaxID=3461371 RepID=UPI00404535EE